MAVNTFLEIVHTARHTKKGEDGLSHYPNRKEGGAQIFLADHGEVVTR